MDGTGSNLKQEDVRTSGLSSKKRRKSQSPSLSGDLGVAQVINVNYEEFFVTLRIIIGNDFENERVPVPLTFPNAGTRHMLGAMPEVGDYCVCGWMPQDTIGAGLGNNKGTKTPIILAWIPRGAWLGHDWVYTSPLTENDSSMSPQKKDELRGVYTEHRHKRLHLRPGDVVASSSKGSDILLNEGVYITNRRANEIRLRDQDQAFVVRSQQQFHSMSGARIYGGMIQRDSRLLQGAVVSDGLWRSQPVQVDTEGNPVKSLSSWLFGSGQYAFAPSIRDIGLDTDLIPEQILGQSGLLLFGRDESVVYGGKPIYRVAIDKDNESINNTLGAELPTFTEYRIELNHYSDGLLPVTEQTEGLDVDREINLLEVAYGTVVGNDPINGGALYGKPLVAEIFPNSKIDAISETHTIQDHLASLFKVNSLSTDGLALTPTFVAVNKDGRVKVSIGGKKDTNSFDMRVDGNTRLSFDGGVTFNTQKPFKVTTQGQTDPKNIGVQLYSEVGALVIEAKGKITQSQSERVNPTGTRGTPQASPSVLITSPETHILGDEGVEITSKRAKIQAAETMDIDGGNSINMTVGDGIIKAQSKQWDQTTTGRADYNHSGPLSNQLGVASMQKLPLRKTTFSSASARVSKKTVDEHKYTVGSREETFTVGNHSTTMRVGNMTYTLNSGVHTVKVGRTTQEMKIGSYTVNVPSVGGNVSIGASGSATLRGNSSVTVRTNGTATVQGGTKVILKVGVGLQKGILSTSDLNPLNGQPFGSPLNGMQGSKKHFIV